MRSKRPIIDSPSNSTKSCPLHCCRWTLTVLGTDSFFKNEAHTSNLRLMVSKPIIFHLVSPLFRFLKALTVPRSLPPGAQHMSKIHLVELACISSPSLKASTTAALAASRPIVPSGIEL
uniref:Uncharacterized protein n=1 Tax=Babesia bovis TaxID=5865 RepID=S6B181_BABBO|nr:hypothetical protein [Babesia bovis]